MLSVASPLPARSSWHLPRLADPMAGVRPHGNDRFSHAGWEFRCVSAPISGVHKLLALGRQLASPYVDSEDAGAPLPFCVHGATRSLKPCTCGSALVMGVRMHMPDAVFGDNVLLCVLKLRLDVDTVHYLGLLGRSCRPVLLYALQRSTPANQPPSL